MTGNAWDHGERPPRPPRRSGQPLLVIAAGALLAVLVGMAAYFAVSGLSGPAHSGRPVSAAASTAPTPSGPASPEADPATVVQAYFDAINSGDYQTAWILGGKNISAGSYDTFVQSLDNTEFDTVTVTSVSGDTVSVQLDATQTDGTHTAFSGTYTVRDGIIVSADIQPQASTSAL